MGSRFGEEGRRLCVRTTLDKRFYPELWDVRSQL
jgi:tryptophan 2,3-dioxygenase